MNFADTNWLEAMFFDQTLKAVAVAEGMEVFPPLDSAGKQLLAKLKG